MNQNFRTLLCASAIASLVLMSACSKPPEAGSVAQPGTPDAASLPNVADVDVTTNVKTALLQDETLKGFDITVITLKGDVRLIGVVNTQGQIDSAHKLARDAAGVHSIHDELTLKK